MKFTFALLLLTNLSVFGSPIQPFSLPQMNGDGGTYNMADHPKGIFVVEAYFLGCHYCNENAPQVNALAEKYSNDSNVQVLDVGVDKKNADYATWIQKHEPNHPVLKDGSKKLIEQLFTMAYPSTYVIDCNGKVVAQTVGGWGAPEKQKIESAIEKLQKEECIPKSSS